jgi:phosphonate degradation associated HDIG domain protein
MEIVEEVVQLFRDRGSSMYGSERVTQLEHALQAATLAQTSNASDTLVAAALVHDIGHLVHDLPADAPDQGIDDRHEELGDAWLEQHFVQALCEPVRLHVPAKRYLCTVEESYGKNLSPASVTSLKLQGGLMSHEEVAEFEAFDYHRDAVQLRRWDDEAKVAGLTTPPIESFRPQLQASLKT